MSDTYEPAFPVSTIDNFTQFGMSLRDYFAGQALAGILADSSLSAAIKAEQGMIVRTAYLIADAMLAERAK